MQSGVDYKHRLKVSRLDYKPRLKSVETRLQTQIDGLRAHTDERIDAVERRFREQLEGTETKLLTAFHNWAQTYEVRARGTSTAVREFEERLGMIEERPAKLERSRN